MRALLQVLVRVAVAVLAFLRQHKARQRTDAVRDDPADEWLRKFGGTDQRVDAKPPANSDNTGSHRD